MTKIEKLTLNLRDRIRSGEWGGAQALPSRMMLSEEYGVAPGTISQVFKNLELEGLVRILPRKGVLLTDTGNQEAPADSDGAIALRGSYVRMGTVGKPGVRGYQSNLVNQILEAAHEQGVPVLILQERPGEEPLTKKRCQAMGLRGVIYLGGDVDGEARGLACEGFPVISANRPLERSPLNYVDCDHVLLMDDLVRRFAKAGHRRIGMLIPPTAIPNLLYRLKPNFINALLSCGLQYNVNPYWLELPKGAEGEEVIALWRMRAAELLALPEPPTAFFCWGRDVVTSLLPVLQEHGVSIPGDVSVAYTPYCEMAAPQISGYSYQGVDIGGKLVHGLMETIRNPFYFLQEEAPFEFIDQGSIAPPKSIR